MKSSGTEAPSDKPVAEVGFTATLDAATGQLRAETDPATPQIDNKRLIAIKNMRVVFYAQSEEGQPTTVSKVLDSEFVVYRGQATGKDLLSFDFDTNRLKVKNTATVEIKDYTVLIFLSPSDALKEATQVGQPYTALKKPLAHDFSPKGDLSMIYSVYSNLEDPIHLKKEELMDSQKSGHLKVMTPTLKALSAMVYLQISEQVTDSDYYLSSGSSVQVFVDAQRKTFVPIPQMMEIQLDNQTTTSIPKSEPYSGLAITKEQLEPHFLYFDEQNLKSNRHRFAAGMHPEGSWIIPIPENTVAATDVHTYTTTRLILRPQIIPKSIEADFELDCQKGEKKDGPQYGWLKVGDKYYTLRTFQVAYKAIAQKDKPSKTEKIILDAGKELTAHVLKVSVNKITKSEPLKAPKYNYASENLEYYAEGRSYKVIPIRHFKDDQLRQRNSDGRFAVVRNTLYYYDLTFDSVGACTMEQYNLFLRYDSESVLGDVSVGIATPSIIYTKQSI